MELKRGDLGYANGWYNDSYENYKALVEEAKANGWEIKEEKIGRCETKYSCEEGGWYYFVDSSD